MERAIALASSVFRSLGERVEGEVGRAITAEDFSVVFRSGDQDVFCEKSEMVWFNPGTLG